MVRCYWCPSCNQWGRRFQYGCRKCKIGQFKHSKCGRWVTAQYGFCPICYPDRLVPKPRKVIRDREKEREDKIMSRSRMWTGSSYDVEKGTLTIPKGKPTMPKGWIITQVVRDIKVPIEERPTMPKGWYDGKQEVRQETSYIIKKDSENFTE